MSNEDINIKHDMNTEEAASNINSAESMQGSSEMHEQSTNVNSATHKAAQSVDESHSEKSELPEIPNLITVVKQYPAIKHSHKIEKALHFAEGPFFSLLVVTILSILVIKGTKKAKLIPGKLQNVIELFIEKFEGLVCDILGQKNGRRFLPYIGTLFIFIFFNNLLGIIPFMKAPTSMIQTTAALAIMTFVYVQFVGIKENGIFGYIHHLAGSPRDPISWIMVPLMFPLHVISELAKPLSLALRLFGNILGEDILLGAFVFMGIGLFKLLSMGYSIPVGFPLHLPFMFLALLTSAIQALVFSMLSTIYFMLVLPHDEEHGEEKH